jgi:hypothetical protein
LSRQSSLDIPSQRREFGGSRAQLLSLVTLAASLRDHGQLSHHPLVCWAPLDRLLESLIGGPKIPRLAVPLVSMQLLGTNHSVNRWVVARTSFDVSQT